MIEQHEDETFSQYIRRLAKLMEEQDVDYFTLVTALLECSDQIELLEAQIERVRHELTAKNYVMMGAGR